MLAGDIIFLCFIFAIPVCCLFAVCAVAFTNGMSNVRNYYHTRCSDYCMHRDTDLYHRY